MTKKSMIVKSAYDLMEKFVQYNYKKVLVVNIASKINYDYAEAGTQRTAGG